MNISVLEKTTKTLRAVIYARVSTEEQAKKDFSIPEIQLPKCSELISNNGWQFVKTYSDAGFHGNAFIKRPGLQSMLEERNEYDVVVVYSFDRLVRDDEMTRANIFNILDQSGKQITSVLQQTQIVASDKYDPKSLNASTFRTISGLQVGFDSKIRRERFMASRIKTVEGGRHIVEAPYGYKIIYEQDPNNTKRTIGYRAPNEEAIVLRRIYEQRADGKGLLDITAGLNRDGIKTKRGKEWTIWNLRRLLDNPFPAGFIAWGKSTDRKHGDKRVQKFFSKDKWILTAVDTAKEIYYKPIISKQLYDRIQEITAMNRHLVFRAKDSRNILAGVLKCECGAGMVGSSFYKFKHPPFFNFYYLCSNWIYKKTCTNKRFNAATIQEKVLREIEKYLNDPELFESWKQQRRMVKLSDKGKEIAGYDKKLKMTQERIYTLQVKYLDKKFSDTDYQKLLNNLQAEEEGIKNKVFAAKQELESLKQKEQNVLSVRMMSQEIGNKLRKMDLKKQKIAVQALIEKIVLNKDGSTKIFFKV